MQSKRLIPLAAMEQIIKKAGAERVSESAKKALKEVLEDYGSKIAADAVRFALHTGRKTVKAEDINLAVRK
ncbi:histone [Candidatus Woesearchaeota archaeon]|nr:MAG: histone [Candidatus Woesearchaeota archaeon]